MPPDHPIWDSPLEIERQRRFPYPEHLSGQQDFPRLLSQPHPMEAAGIMSLQALAAHSLGLEHGEEDQAMMMHTGAEGRQRPIPPQPILSLQAMASRQVGAQQGFREAELRGLEPEPEEPEVQGEILLPAKPPLTAPKPPRTAQKPPRTEHKPPLTAPKPPRTEHKPPLTAQKPRSQEVQQHQEERLRKNE